MRSAPDKAEVYSRAGGARLRERERACRFWACFARRGLFWACFSPATDDENCDAPEGAPHEVSRGAYMRGRMCGIDGMRVWGARAWPSGVTEDVVQRLAL